MPKGNKEKINYEQAAAHLKHAYDLQYQQFIQELNRAKKAENGKNGKKVFDQKVAQIKINLDNQMAALNKAYADQQNAEKAEAPQPAAPPQTAAPAQPAAKASPSASAPAQGDYHKLYKKDLAKLYNDMANDAELGYILPDGTIGVLPKEAIGKMVTDPAFTEEMFLLEDPQDTEDYERGGIEELEEKARLDIEKAAQDYAKNPVAPKSGDPKKDYIDALRLGADKQKEYNEKMRNSPFWKAKFQNNPDELNALIDQKNQQVEDQFKNQEARIAKFTPEELDNYKKAQENYIKAASDFKKSGAKEVTPELQKANLDLQKAAANAEEKAAYEAKAAEEKAKLDKQSAADLKKGIALHGLHAVPYAIGALSGNLGGAAATGAGAAGATGAANAVGSAAASAAGSAAGSAFNMSTFQKILAASGLAAAVKYAQEVISGKGGAVSEFLHGKEGFENFTPEQQKLIGRLGQLGIQGLENNQYTPEKIEEAARHNFATKTIPSITERFSNSGGSSALGNQLREGGQELEHKLAGLKYAHGAQQQGHFTNLAQLGITPKFPNATYDPNASSGFLDKLAPLAINAGTKYLGL